MRPSARAFAPSRSWPVFAISALVACRSAPEGTVQTRWLGEPDGGGRLEVRLVARGVETAELISVYPTGFPAPGVVALQRSVGDAWRATVDPSLVGVRDGGPGARAYVLFGAAEPMADVLEAFGRELAREPQRGAELLARVAKEGRVGLVAVGAP